MRYTYVINTNIIISESKTENTSVLLQNPPCNPPKYEYVHQSNTLIFKLEKKPLSEKEIEMIMVIKYLYY